MNINNLHSFVNKRTSLDMFIEQKHKTSRIDFGMFLIYWL